MGALAFLNILGVAGGLIGGAIELGEGVHNVETVKILEAYRHTPMTKPQRQQLAVAIAPRLPGKARFLAPAIASAQTQWQRDVTVGLIETELFR